MSKTSNICNLLSHFMSPTNRLLHYLGICGRGNLDDICKESPFEKDEIIETRCGYIGDTIEYLLSSSIKTPTMEILPHFLILYNIELIGIDNHGCETGLTHVMYMIYIDDEWLIMDSYIGCKKFECKIVNYNHIIGLLQSLSKKYDHTIWKELTGCEELYFTADLINVDIYRSTCSLKNIECLFTQLVKYIQKKSSSGFEGDYDFIPGNVNSIRDVENYLNSIHCQTLIQ